LLAGRGEIVTLSPATVQRIWAERVLKPHRFRYWLTRTDPEFEQKREEIVNLDGEPPRPSRLLGLEEKTGLQAWERLYPTWPLRPGPIERQEFEYRRHGVVDLLAAFDGQTGQVFGQCYRQHTHREFRHFWRTLRAHDPDSRWHLILDNASYHTQQEVLDGCAVQRPKITLHWLPAHGSWLNQVESWFSILTRKCLRRASVGSTRQLRHWLHRFLGTWNQHFAHPFKWTDTGKPLAVSAEQLDWEAA
jgi:putative transposase